MKNHYVSQFIIKRFSKAINIFNVKSGHIDESKRPNKVFYKKDIYDEELEKKMNFNIESKVSNILNNKIDGQEIIILTREDLQILKRYMLICSVRTQDVTSFADLLLSFDRNAEKYIAIYNEYSTLPNIKELCLSNEEIYFRALKVFATTNTIRDIAANPLATKEILAWALPFIESYIAFWDAPSDKEFILTDCGMCCEYEGFHMLTGGLDVSKFSYLLKQINDYKTEYISLFASNIIMYENFSIYNLSSKRSMVMINPFFRLYFQQNFNGLDINNKIYNIKLEKPDIWPAIIQNKELFNIPQNRYKVCEDIFCLDDEFIYTPKILTDEDLIYLNTLMLSQTNVIIGFNDPTKIIDSIYYFVWHESNFNSVYSRNESREDIINRLIENTVNSPFRELCNYCDLKGGKNQTEFIFLFEKLLGYIYKDFRENPYISEYFLKNPQETINCKALDFLGEGNKKLEFFRNHLEKIKEERND